MSIDAANTQQENTTGAEATSGTQGNKSIGGDWQIY